MDVHGASVYLVEYDIVFAELWLGMTDLVKNADFHSG